jgi:hypothetical protein
MMEVCAVCCTDNDNAIMIVILTDPNDVISQLVNGMNKKKEKKDIIAFGL